MNPEEIKALTAAAEAIKASVKEFNELTVKQNDEIRKYGAVTDETAAAVTKHEKFIVQATMDLERFSKATERIDELQARLDEIDRKNADGRIGDPEGFASDRSRIAKSFLENAQVKAAILDFSNRGVAASSNQSTFSVKGSLLQNRGAGLELAAKAVYSQPELVQARRMTEIIGLLPEPLHVRDIIPVQRLVGTNTVEWLHTTIFDVAAGSGLTRTGAAAPVADGDTKPESKWAAGLLSRSLTTIAHVIHITKQTARDFSQVHRKIENDLLLGLATVEDYQLLYGSGTGSDVSGLTSYAINEFVWSTDGVTGDTRIDALRKAMTLCYAAYHVPTGIMINHEDWQDLQLTKAESDGHYLLMQLHQGGLGGTGFFAVPVIPTNVVATGSAFVGAWNTGATIWEGESANLATSDQHDQNFVKNLLTIRAEQAELLVCERPEAFCEVTFDAPPA